MTTWETARSNWAMIKPRAMWLAIGLVVGPFITNYLGWQVTSSTAQAQARAGVVEQLAGICDVGARTAVPEPAKLDWMARAELAKKWAIMPGATAADSEVSSACQRKLQT
jgi:hypothetical protein